MIFFLLPCYNEEKAIRPVLRNIASSLEAGGYKIVIVDDGSEDKSAGVADKIAADLNIPVKVLRHSLNYGLGRAMRTGLDWICKNAGRGDFVITMDCDNTHPADVAVRMLEKLCGCDFVIASRFVNGGSQKGVPFLRGFLSRSASQFFRLFYPAVSDWTSGFRAYRVEVLRKLEVPGRIREKGFTSQLEILLILLKGKSRVCEVPLELDYMRKMGRSKMSFFPVVFSYLKFFFYILTKQRFYGKNCDYD